MSNAFPLPLNLPVPVDDGACRHLAGMRLPAVALPSTGGRVVDLQRLVAVRTVIYCYPMTGVPGNRCRRDGTLFLERAGARHRRWGFGIITMNSSRSASTYLV